jgi:hypothetical protein
MKDFIQLNQVKSWRYDVMLRGKKFIGTFEHDCDGYFYYCFPNVLIPGIIPHHVLRELADKLQEINEPWDAIIRQKLAKSFHIDNLILAYL